MANWLMGALFLIDIFLAETKAEKKKNCICFLMQQSLDNNTSLQGILTNLSFIIFCTKN